MKEHPRAGGLEAQDSEYVDWMLKMHGFVAEAERITSTGQQPNTQRKLEEADEKPQFDQDKPIEYIEWD